MYSTSDIFLLSPVRIRISLKTGFGDCSHFLLYFWGIQLCAVDFIVTVETTVDTVVFAVV